MMVLLCLVSGVGCHHHLPLIQVKRALELESSEKMEKGNLWQQVSHYHQFHHLCLYPCKAEELCGNCVPGPAPLMWKMSTAPLHLLFLLILSPPVILCPHLLQHLFQ